MRRILFAAILLGSTAGAMPAFAQSAIEGRVDRLEREMRAVQRKVFPGGAGQTIEPQITPPQQPQVQPGAPASSPVADLTSRIVALEAQSSTLTGQVEQIQYRLRQMEDAFSAYKRSTDARLKALEDTNSAVGSDAPAPADAGSAPGGIGSTRPPAGPKPGKPAPKPAEPASNAGAGVERPSTGDDAEDAYLYGYRLWQAKAYGDAETQLKAVVAKYPKHRRASFAQNLLGRAYLDEGKPSLAAVAFYENYKKMPDGERAPDSLYYLAQSLVKLKKPASEVCKVYGELTDVYGDRISDEMKARIATGRADAKCK